jgi:Ca2+-binding EF-hand superfamily protein
MLSKDELPQDLQNGFKDIDKNNDNMLSAEELTQHVQRMSQRRPQIVEVIYFCLDGPEREPVSAEELQVAYEFLLQLDKNKDGKIDDDDLRQVRQERSQQRLDRVFKSMDRNQDNKISKDEARGIWSEHFDQLDKNKDQFLDQDEINAAFQMRGDANQGKGQSLPHQGQGQRNPGQGQGTTNPTNPGTPPPVRK